VYGTKPNVPEYVIKNGTTYRIVSDHLGSPRVIVDATTGAAVQRMDFYAFGEIVQDSNPGWQPFGFAGGLYDSDSRLLRFGARDYDPSSGRWLATDPIGFGGRDPNLQAYVGGDAVNRIDSTGLDWISNLGISLLALQTRRASVSDRWPDRCLTPRWARTSRQPLMHAH
jgi:RHS repeat-associated protein